MERITTDNPKGLTSNMLNKVFVKDKDVWIREASEDFEDISLYDYMRQYKEDWNGYSNEDIADLMCDEIGDPLDLLYWLAVGFAENRERLMEYEDTDLFPEEITEQQRKRLEPLEVGINQDALVKEKPYYEDDGLVYCGKCGALIYNERANSYEACGIEIDWSETK